MGFALQKLLIHLSIWEGTNRIYKLLLQLCRSYQGARKRTREPEKRMDARHCLPCGFSSSIYDVTTRKWRNGPIKRFLQLLGPSLGRPQSKKMPGRCVESFLPFRFHSVSNGREKPRRTKELGRKEWHLVHSSFWTARKTDHELMNIFCYFWPRAFSSVKAILEMCLLFLLLLFFEVTKWRNSTKLTRIDSRLLMNN